MHPSALICKCGCNQEPCACGCPCGTGGGVVSCDLRELHPIDAELTLTSTPFETEFYVGSSVLYSNLDDIADWIAETDTPSAGNYTGVLFKIRVNASLSTDTYTITDNTSIGFCQTSHVGLLMRRKALNGDTYEFDAMGGMPRIVQTLTVLSTTRRSDNDVSGVDGSGDTYENHFWESPTVVDDDEANGWWLSSAIVNSTGATAFATYYYPDARSVPYALNLNRTSIARWKHTRRLINITDDSATTDHMVVSLGDPLVTPDGEDLPLNSGFIPLVGIGTQLIDMIGGAPETAGNICQGDIDSSADDAGDVGYAFDVNDYSSATGSYTNIHSQPAPHLSPTKFFSAATFDYFSATAEPNMIGEIAATATVGTRDNPGGQNCSRCYDVTFTQTDGDTSAVTTIFGGELIQVVDSRIAPGEDPRTRNTWVTQTVWNSATGVYPMMSLYRVGKELWVGEVTPSSGAQKGFYHFKGDDCPDTITEVLASVEEIGTLTTSGAGTVASPTVRTYSSRLKIDTRSFTATAQDCTTCLEDPCEDPCPTETVLWNTGEEVTSERDDHWEIETAEGSDTYEAAWSYPTQPLHYDPGAGATWIGLEDGVAFPADEIRKFRLIFNIAGTPADITGTLYADNSVESIVINGDVVDGPIATFPYSFTLPAASLVSGSNTLIMEVHGDGIVTDGLLVIWD